jgi:hypothetical protein
MSSAPRVTPPISRQPLNPGVQSRQIIGQCGNDVPHALDLG